MLSDHENKEFEVTIRDVIDQGKMKEMHRGI